MWQLSASTSAVTPAIEQIRNRVSDTNPLVLTAGNPNLRQGCNIEAGISYLPPTRQQGVGRNSSFTASLNGGIYLNPIVARVWYFNEQTVLSDYDGYIAGAGSMLNTFDNSRQPRINLAAQASYTKSFLRHNLKVVLTLKDNYLRSPMYKGDALVAMDENSVHGSAWLTFTPSRMFYATNSLSAAYIVSSSRSEVLSGRINVRDSFSTRWFITKWLKLNAVYSLSAFRYTTGVGTDYFSQVLDAGLSVPLGPQFEIALWGYDILNSGSLYATQINSTMMSQTWTPTYGRNIMLKIVYRFRKKNL